MTGLPGALAIGDPVRCIASSSQTLPDASACITAMCSPDSGAAFPTGGPGKVTPSVANCAATISYTSGTGSAGYRAAVCDEGSYGYSVTVCNAQPLVVPAPRNMVTPALQGAADSYAGYVVLGFGLIVVLALLGGGLAIFVRFVRRAVDPNFEFSSDPGGKIGEETIVGSWSEGDPYDPMFGDVTFGDGGASGGFDPFGGDVDGGGGAMSSDEIAEAFPEAHQDIEEATEEEMEDD